MFLLAWLRCRKAPPPSPVPDAADQVTTQAAELRRVVAQLKEMNATTPRERNA